MMTRSWFCRLSVILVATAAVATAMRAEPVTPDAAAARQFGFELARDYAVRGSDAVVNRIDDEAMQRLIFGPTVGTPAAQETWKRDTRGGVGVEARKLSGFPVLVACRVMLIDDARWLECQFLSTAGAPELARFRLVQSRLGTVRIADLLLGGDGVSFVRRVRHLYLLEHVELGDVSDDEIPLWAAGENYSTQVQVALSNYGGNGDAALLGLKGLPSSIRDTAVWRYYRDALAFAGWQSACADLDRDIADGGAVDPFVRFRRAVQRGGTAAALAALDDILRRFDYPLLYRCAKANLLLNSGRPAEAYAIASDVIALMPGAGFVYVTAVKAAAAEHKPALALPVLKRWALIAPPREIDKALHGEPALPAAFFTSTPYLEWLNLSPTAPGLLSR